MTALATNFARAREGVQPVVALTGGFPVAASTHIYVGALVAINSAGNVVPASADSTLFVIGVAEEEVDNSAGIAGARTLNAIRRGSHLFTNSSTTGAIVDLDIGRPCYVVDDNTVSRLSSDGTRPVAGIVRRVDAASGLVSVEVGLGSRNAIEGVTDYLYLAGADLSTTGQYLFVKLNGSSAIVLADTAGEAALGVLQNAPASGAVAIVRRRGPSRVVGGATLADGAILALAALHAVDDSATREEADVYERLGRVERSEHVVRVVYGLVQVARPHGVRELRCEQHVHLVVYRGHAGCAPFVVTRSSSREAHSAIVRARVHLARAHAASTYGRPSATDTGIGGVNHPPPRWMRVDRTKSANADRCQARRSRFRIRRKRATPSASSSGLVGFCIDGIVARVGRHVKAVRSPTASPTRSSS